MKIVKKQITPVSSYVVIDIVLLEIGQPLAFDVFIKKSDEYIIIIEAGTILSDNLYLKLEKQDDVYISAKDKDLTKLSCTSLKQYLKHNKDNVQRCLDILYSITTPVYQNFLNNDDNKIDVECIKYVVKSIIYLIQDNKDYVRNTIPLFMNKDELAHHSLHVSVYSLNVGYLLKLKEDKLIQLGIATMMHDIGHKKIDNQIMGKERTLSEQEVKHVQRHINHSVDIAKHNHIVEPYILDAITHHHELYDGSGYPDKLKSEEISDFASIISICDVFEALTSDRPHRKKYTTFEALKMMMKDSDMSNKFNNNYIKTLLKSLS